MAAILVLLLVSWIILWWLRREQLTVLGTGLTKQRSIQLLAGLLLAGGCCAVYHHLSLIFTINYWRYNNAFTLSQGLRSGWWVLRSVLVETLVFNGALLYLSIKKWGVWKGCLLSAACFGVYHWFSYGVLGNLMGMCLVFIMTFLMGLVFAQAFARTRSLYLPIGLHIGWNLVNVTLFSAGPLGRQLFYQANHVHATGGWSLFVWLFQLLALPMASWCYLQWWSKNEDRPLNRPSSLIKSRHSST